MSIVEPVHEVLILYLIVFNAPRALLSQISLRASHNVKLSTRQRTTFPCRDIRLRSRSFMTDSYKLEVTVQSFRNLHVTTPALLVSLFLLLFGCLPLFFLFFLLLLTFGFDKYSSYSFQYHSTLANPTRIPTNRKTKVISSHLKSCLPRRMYGSPSGGRPPPFVLLHWSLG